MKSALAILAGLLVGVLVAAGVLAAFVFVGPDPVGLRPTPSPSEVVVASPSIAPSASPSPEASFAPSASPSVAPLALPSTAPSGSAPGSGSPSPGGASQAAFHAGEPAPPLVVDQLAAGAAGRPWARRAAPLDSSPPR
ncbi:MAG TPA: hypothetical protein VID95_10235 [Candidatus Limnocylindrales bacterium]